ncbi:MAG: PKD domain-containing protein, partial [Verrucomicrobiaceae bacterium]
TRRYLKAPVEERAALVAEGVALAEARRPVFQALIRDNPREALQAAVPMVERQDLPKEVTARLEDRVNARGALRVYQGVGPDNLTPVPTHRVAELANGSTYQAYVYGRRTESVQWVADTSVNGVAVDRDLAVNEEPFRPLETGERPDPEKTSVEVCPVSGQTSLKEEDKGEPITEQTPAVEAYGEIVYLCDGSHTTVFRQTLIQAEGASGGSQTFTGLLPAAPTPSIGSVKVLVIPMTFADQNSIPATETTLYNLMRGVGSHYAKASYGKLTLLSTVAPPVTLPHNEAWYVQQDTSNGGPIDGLGLEHSHARAEARKLGFDDDDYDCVVVRLKGGARPAGGWGGGRSVWIYGDGPDVTAHEVGHVFGLAHANFWDTAGTSAIGPGTNAEYGGHYDVMGGFGLPDGHYNAQAKNQIRWLPDSFAPWVTSGGLYRIHAQDQAMLDPGKRYALRIRKDNLRTYWGELRGLYTGSPTEPWADKGLILGWKYPGAGGNNIQLIDTTPGSAFGKPDAPISLGRTFSDTEAGIHITTLAVNPATASEPKSVDVQVNFGGFPDNIPPRLSLAVSASVVPIGAPVTFTATASDEDGDALAFSWRHFGDPDHPEVSPNAPVITRSFAAPGTYVVACTVSDMKGGTAIRSRLVTVGDGGGRSVISGRVTQDGAGLAGVTVNANSANGMITDSDGYYTIPNLPGGTTWILTPLLHGWTFNPLFGNSVRTPPGAERADFEAVAIPQVTLTAPVPAGEGNAEPGKFLLTRTGDLSQDLTVNFTGFTGTAGAGDYTMTPAPAPASQSLLSLTIPAGLDQLELAVTPVDDAASEGTEILTLRMAAGNGYLTAGPGSASMGIQDNDTALPRVMLAVVTASTVEGSAAPATVRVSRTGDPAAPLTVAYEVSGTAESGRDFRALPGMVEIPAGSSNGLISVESLDDAVPRGTRTVALKLKLQAASIHDSTTATATVSIVDDDLQVVNVTAGDPIATERDLSIPGTVPDTATFLITRTGGTELPLTVYYAMAGASSGGMATALHGVDYEALPGVLTLLAGQSSGAVTIVPCWDGIGEGAESVTVQLGAGRTSYQLGPDNTADAVIMDAGDPPYVEVTGMDSAEEGQPVVPGLFRFSLKGSAAGPVDVKYTVGGTAVSGVDFTPLSGSVTIPGDGMNLVDVPVTPLNDGIPEDLESITVTLTPDPAYGIFAPTGSAMIRIRDAGQPTVSVDAGDSGYPPSFSEDSNGAAFYLSRTGATGEALMVNYILAGSAIAGEDYTAMSGGALIPAGARGVPVPIRPINDTLTEGTETVELTLAAGAYSRSPAPAGFYLTDNETPEVAAGFAVPGMAVQENAGTVEVPVVLSAPSGAPVTVEYLVDRGSHDTESTAGASTGAGPGLPYWIRCRKSGGTVTGLISKDGQNWTEISSQTLSFATPGSLAGLAVCSWNTSIASTARFDNVTVEAGPGAVVGGDFSGGRLGNTALAGSHSVSGGVFTVSGGGDNLDGTTDQGYFVSWPVSGGDCTITARVVSLANTNAQASATVMIRESGVNNAARGFTSVTAGAWVEFHVRAATGLLDSKFSAPGSPFWLRLERAGDLLSAFQSADGAAWVPVGSTVSLPMGEAVMVGLALSSFVDGETAAASFDQVSMAFGSEGLEGTEGWEGRTIGFSGVQGTSGTADGVCRVTASGDGFEGAEDSGFYVSRPMMGNFTLTARVLETRGPGTTLAGLMLRQADDRRSRMAFIGAAAGGTPRFIRRLTSTNTALGAGVDYTLPPGTLTFPPGTTSASIPVQVRNDTLPEPDESVIIVLRNARGARIGAGYQFALVIGDDDKLQPQRSVGFSALSGTVAEGAGTVRIPVALSVVPAQAVTVGYTVEAGTAVAGTDFTPATGQLQFAPGQTVAEVPVTLLDDAIGEPDKTISITLSGGTGAVLGTLAVHTLTIADDDRAVVTLNSPDPSASEAGDPGTVTFTRTGPLTEPLTVNYSLSGTAVSGVDYTGLAGSVVIPAGAASQDAILTPMQDALPEGAETVVLALAEGSGYTMGPAGSVTLTIADDDRNTVTISASAPAITEGGGAGMFTVTRSGDVSAGLTVGLTLTGTATAGADFTTAPSNSAALVFAAGQTVLTVTVTPVDDGLVEGGKVILAQLTAGSYDISGDGYASLILVDNDTPPSVYIQSPGAQGVVVAPGHGLRLRAVLSDDGLPRPASAVWSVVTGPGAVVFDAPTGSGAETGAMFSEPGTYLVRVTASDGLFSGSDQTAITVTDSASALPAGWISADIGVPGTRGFSGMLGNVWRLNGAGSGYEPNADQAHAAGRTIEGDGAITARLTEVNNAHGAASNAEAGLFIRDSWQRSARRAVLAWTPAGSTLKFRARPTAGTAGTSVTVTGLNLPLWLKLARGRDTNTITAFQAPDNNGQPGTWTPVGSSAVIAMDAGADYGLTTDSGSDSVLAEGVFDNVSLTPDAAGSAVVSEDFGDGPQTGTYRYTPADDLHVMEGQAGGLESKSMFRGQQYTGDFMITVLQLDASSGAANAYSGLMIRDTMDDGPMAFAGRNPFSAYSSFVWRTNPKGVTGGVNGISQKTRWLRLTRRGNQITALHAPDNGGSPGGWTQLGQTRPVFMSPSVLAGLAVCNGDGVGFNTARFTKLSVVPLNRAPVVDVSGVSSGDTPPVTVTLKGHVQDDGQPLPVTTEWTSLPGTAVFADPAALETTAQMAAPGTYRLRLWADDGLAGGFGQVTVAAAGAATAFETWQEANFPSAGGVGDAAALADPDHDGLMNLCEYALGSDPNTGSGSALTIQSPFEGPDGKARIRIILPKNRAATDAVLQVEVSTDPGATPAVWNTGGLAVEFESATELRVLDTQAGSPCRFYRLRVTRAG